MDHSGATGIFARASGYTTNVKPGPATVNRMKCGHRCNYAEASHTFGQTGNWRTKNLIKKKKEKKMKKERKKERKKGKEKEEE